MPLEKSCGVHRHGIQQVQKQEEPSSVEMIPFWVLLAFGLRGRQLGVLLHISCKNLPLPHRKTGNLGTFATWKVFCLFVFLRCFLGWFLLVPGAGVTLGAGCGSQIGHPGEHESTWKALRVISTPAGSIGGGQTQTRHFWEQQQQTQPHFTTKAPS